MVAGIIDIRKALRRLAPTPTVKPLAWFEEYGRTDEGKPYDHSGHPHIGNPGGPCDALTDWRVRTIALQFGSRMGKTFFAQSAQQYFADISPGPGMIASESEKLAIEITGRWYAMAEGNKRLRDQLKPPRFRKQSRIDLPASKIYVAWARSVSTLADKAVRYGHANEVDKWEHQSTSKEADPLKLFTDRGKQYPRRKFIIESTPAVKGRSRIERLLLYSTNCRYYVPCPHCKHYQTLRMGDGSTAGGIVWQKPEHGHSDPDLAQTTAHYVCESCSERIDDHHRAWMMRRGVWCPEGCGVDSSVALDLFDERGRCDRDWLGWAKAPWLVGTPARNGTDAGYQISSLYALSLSWGDVAAEFLRVKDKPQELRNFVNQWLGETWELIARKQTWEQLGERIIGETPYLIVPPWASLLFVGVDRQKDGFPFVVDAYGPDERTATILYGQADDLSEVRSLVIERAYKHADGGDDVRPSLVLVDSGYRPEGVYEFCRQCQKTKLNVWPSKGSNKALMADFIANELGDNTSMPGMVLYHVDTVRSQGWIDRQLHDLNRDDPGGHSLYAGSLSEHRDHLEQLLNDAVVEDLDSANNNRESYERISTDIPNDWRDCRRYARAARLIFLHGAPVPQRVRVYSRPMVQPEEPSRVRQLNWRR